MTDHVFEVRGIATIVPTALDILSVLSSGLRCNIEQLSCNGCGQKPNKSCPNSIPPQLPISLDSLTKVFDGLLPDIILGSAVSHRPVI